MSYSNKNVVKCDSSMVTKWYRFSDTAGRAMPETCVATWRCGTHAPGWLNGKHPTVAQGIVTRQVCYHWNNNCCNWNNNIRIRNCGGFYVYELRKPPGCSMRYCGASGAIGEFYYEFVLQYRDIYYYFMDRFSVLLLAGSLMTK